MKLTDRFDDTISYGDDVLEIDFSFDNVLRIYELLDDKSFENYEKVLIMWEMLVIDCDNYDYSFEQKNGIIKEIIETQIASKKKEGSKSEENKKYFDMVRDAEYIYASFLYDYGIDLFDVQGILHWRKFLSLLNSLSSKSKLSEVIGIRQQKIPKLTKHNKEERERIIKLKQLYKLDDEGMSVENADRIMASISASIKKGGG